MATTRHAGRLLAATHALLLPAGALLVWWLAQPVRPASATAQLGTYFWPYMLLLTAGPGVVAGLLEARLLRRRPVAAVAVAMAGSFVGLWLPRFTVSHDPAGVIPVETGDLVAALVLWTLFWAGHTFTVLLAGRHRDGAPAAKPRTVTNGP